MTDAKLKGYLREMQMDWALRWCEPGRMGCACLGCANNSGGLAKRGATKEQWAKCLRELAEDAAL